MDQLTPSKPRSKLVIRSIPPDFLSADFLDIVAPWKQHIDYFRYVQGKKPTPLTAKPLRPSRAYLNFTSSDALFDFYRATNSMRVRDANGFESELLVEFAPNQTVAFAPDKTAAPLEGTVKSSEEYRAFLAELEASVEPPALPLEKQLELLMVKERELNPWKFDKSITPLLQHLREASLPVKQDKRPKKKQGPSTKAASAAPKNPPATPVRIMARPTTDNHSSTPALDSPTTPVQQRVPPVIKYQSKAQKEAQTSTPKTGRKTVPSDPQKSTPVVYRTRK